MNRETIDHEIAIIGMAGRFPGARSVDEFWENLRNGVESIAFFSDQEVVSSGVNPGMLHNPNYVKAHGVLEDIEFFDASFFGYSPREAEAMDPQQRIFLECAWEALESAGYSTETNEGRVSVYAGTSRSNYLEGVRTNRDLMEALNYHQLIFGNEKDYLPTRVSYILNLKGPSVAVQTACSTSLVAVHLACQSLLNGESDMALAGGVTIRVPQRVGYLYQEGLLYSPDGHCRAFDANARGIVDGSGVGIVVLKRLADALADGDYIHAIIKGSAINNDGSLKIGYTAPSVEGQAEVIAEVLALAGVEPETVTYIETHGTGTALGDPIEIAALTQAFRAQTEKEGFCAIGSVKTNIGHLDSAAGVAGLIKAILALKHRQIPPSLHFKQPNPQIDFTHSPFYVNTVLREWKVGKTLRRAGVSSFGIGGTNAHILLEEAPPIVPPGKTRPWQLLLLSTKTDSALEAATSHLVGYLKQHPDCHLADVAYTYQIGRRTFNHRRMVVSQNADDAALLLETCDPQYVFTSFEKSTDRPVVFMFPGGGTQYANMGAELYRVEATFRAQVDLCTGLLSPYLGIDLRSVLYPGEEQVEAASQQLKQTSLALPALFTTEYALAQLWISWGVHPQAMIGHSLGEYVAACLAGVFSLQDALALVALRGKLLERLPKGATLSVSLSPGELQYLLGQKLSLAAINGPSLCAVSGPLDAIEEMQQSLIAKGVTVHRVHIDVAAHSEMITPILGEFQQFVAKIDLHAPAIPYISNLTGSWITAAEATDPGYWVRHLRQTVHFAEGIRTLLQETGRILLEVGPGQTLSTLVQQQLDNTTEQIVLASLRHPYAQYSDVAFLLNTVGRFWLAGGKVDWQRFYALEQRQRLPLPTYPFERKRYWVEPQLSARPVSASQTTLLKKPDVADWFYIPSSKRSGPPFLSSSEDGADQKTCWLIFADTCGIAAHLGRRLEQAGIDVVIVEKGEQFSKLSDHTYCINPQRREDYSALLEDLQERDPIQIAHLWSVTANNDIHSSLERSEGFGFYSLLTLVQALGTPKKAHIVVVSNQMQEVIGDEAEKATLSELCRVIPHEYEHVSCCSVDIVLPAAGTRDEEQLIDQLEEVLDVFRRVLRQKTLPQVVISTRQPQVTNKQLAAAAVSTTWQEPESAQQSKPPHSRTPSARAYVAPTNELEQTIIALWQKLLGSEQIGIHDSFFELGGNSLMAAQLIARLRETFLVEIPLRSIFEEPTVARLATVVEKAFLEKMETLSEEEIQLLTSDGSGYFN
jgi:acyl transferase domain-containing protein